MHIEDDDANELKTWVISKLTDISDADSDVLADYVLALIRTDTSEAQLKNDVLESLEDFLKDNTASFVAEVFQALQAKSYKPGYVAPRPAVQSPAPGSAPLATSRTNSITDPVVGASLGAQQSKKRSFNETQDTRSGGDSHYAHGDRQKRQIRGNGRGGRGSFGGQRNGHSSSFPPPPLLQGFGNMAPVPQGMAFDPNDPIAAMMAMQAMGLPPLPNMPSFPQASSPTGQPQFSPQTAGLNSEGKKEPCRDYDTKGFCLRGDACPYRHGNDHFVVPGSDEYDPKNSVLMDTSPTSPVTNGFTHREGRGRGRGRGDRGGQQGRRNRAEFSHSGPNQDRSITTIVVEQIPEDKFEEQKVRDFFSAFGNIVEVIMQPYKRLALVKYDDWTSAKQAYDSPRVIFDNRFVKVYWYKPGDVTKANSFAMSGNVQHPTPSDPKSSEDEPFDREKFEQSTQAAQKKLEEKKSQLQEMAAKREALEKQKEQLAAKQAAEKQRLLDRLAAKGASLPDSSGDTSMSDANKPNSLSPNSTNGASVTADSKATAHTALLRAKVAELEAEAKSLGLDASLGGSASSPSWSSRGRGRGERGGRGSYRGWEAFDPSYRGGRGGFRGRGASPYAGFGAGKYNLDNRTKRVEISLLPAGTTWTPDRDEALRQWALGLGEFEDIRGTTIPSISSTPDEGPQHQQVITFKDRTTAESFLFGGSKERDVPGVGKVLLSWFHGEIPGGSTLAAAGVGIPSSGATAAGRGVGNGLSSKGAGTESGQGDDDMADPEMDADGTGMSNTLAADNRSGGGVQQQQQQHQQQQQQNHAEVDYDVAEDEDDRWMDG